MPTATFEPEQVDTPGESLKQSAMRDAPDTPYTRIFWIVVTAGISIVGMGVYSTIATATRMEQMAGELRRVAEKVERMEGDRTALNVIATQMTEQIRLNQEQATKLAALEVWAARADERLRPKSP